MRRLSPAALLPWLALACSNGGGATTPDGGAGSSGSAGVTATAGASGAGSTGSAGATAPGGSTGSAGATATAGTAGGAAGASDGGAADAPTTKPDGGATDAPVVTSDAGAGPTAPVQFYGRWDFTTVPGTAITVYSGAHVTARFNGTGISARLDLSHSQGPVTTVTWQIDGGAWMEGDVKATMPLATGLQPGTHDVVFMARGMEELFNRWNPPVVASLNFLGFDVTGGALVPTARPNRLKIEFLGDSLTEGVRVVMNNASDPWHTNGRLAYPCLVATALGAEWRQVGFGHQGILQTGHGNVPKAIDSLDWVYATVPRDAWVPDVVVLNQGTNDRDASGTAFAPAFSAYLAAIRKSYPSAKLFVLRPFGGYREAEIAAQTNARITAGDANLFYVDTTGWLTAADYTEGLHPNVMGHEKATAALLPILRAKL